MKNRPKWLTYLEEVSSYHIQNLFLLQRRQMEENFYTKMYVIYLLMILEKKDIAEKTWCRGYLYMYALILLWKKCCNFHKAYEMSFSLPTMHELTTVALISIVGTLRDKVTYLICWETLVRSIITHKVTVTGWIWNSSWTGNTIIDSTRIKLNYIHYTPPTMFLQVCHTTFNSLCIHQSPSAPHLISICIFFQCIIVKPLEPYQTILFQCNLCKTVVCYLISNTSCYHEIWIWFQIWNHHWSIPLKLCV